MIFIRFSNIFWNCFYLVPNHTLLKILWNTKNILCLAAVSAGAILTGGVSLQQGSNMLESYALWCVLSLTWAWSFLTKKVQRLPVSPTLPFSLPPVSWLHLSIIWFDGCPKMLLQWQSIIMNESMTLPQIGGAILIKGGTMLWNLPFQKDIHNWIF